MLLSSRHAQFLESPVTVSEPFNSSGYFMFLFVDVIWCSTAENSHIHIAVVIISEVKGSLNWSSKNRVVLLCSCFMTQSQYWQQTPWTWIYAHRAGSCTVSRGFPTRGRISIYIYIYIWTPAAEQSNPFRGKRTEAQRRDLPGDAWIIWEGCSSGSGGVCGCGQVVPGGGAGANPLCPLHAGDTQQLPRHPGRL